jgi:RHS repeat-associated protein
VVVGQNGLAVIISRAKENRLVAMTNNTGVGPLYGLTFTYDAKGRRIEKSVTTNGMAFATQNFLYDGWSPTAILNSQSSILTAFTWGSDLSGSQQGAGGVGGLLTVSYRGTATTNCFVAYDGNGNVASLINAVGGALVASYEYGPFGEVIRQTGPMAKVNPFRFSTKYQDDESDLLYYGHRYYKASTGTWPNHDPIGEPGFEVLRNGKANVASGGVNLYLFVGNDPVLYADNLGLIKVCIRPLLLCPFTTVIVHCFFDMGDGTTFAYDNHGIHADPNPNSYKKTCHDVSPSSITEADIEKVVKADEASGDWDGSKYGFTSHNCCNWVDHVLTTLGSSGVESYFPGYSLP